MEIYQEFVLTVIVSVLLFLLLGKLAATGEHDQGVTGGANDGSIKNSPEEKNHDASPSQLRNSDNNSDLAAGVPDDRIAPAETLRHEDMAEDREAKVELEREIAGEVDLKEEEEKGEEEEGWEGIERSEQEKLFAVATAFANSERGAEELSELSGDVQMQLYALHKVATEGPCYQPQPMALKLSARTKW